MIKNVLAIFPDETAFSWLSRNFAASGYLSQPSFAKEVYAGGKARSSALFLGSLREDFVSAISGVVSLDSLLQDHTVLPYYAVFLPNERRSRVYAMARDCGAKLPGLLPSGKDSEELLLRYCPLCARDDRRDYGEAYFHVSHMIPGARVCLKHRCKLVDTAIPTGGQRASDFVTLENCLGALPSAVVFPEGDINVRIARYAAEVVSSWKGRRLPAQIGSMLSAALPDKYLYRRKAGRNSELIASDMQGFYAGLIGRQIKRLRILDVLINRRWDVFDACLIAMFLGLRADTLTGEIAHKSPDELYNWAEMDARISAELRKELKRGRLIDPFFVNGSYVMKRFGVAPNDFRRLEETKKLLASFKRKRRDWGRTDDECCARFAKAAKRLPLAAITYVKIAEMLGLKNGQLRKLPRLRSAIKRFKEGKTYANHRITVDYDSLDKAYLREFMSRFSGRQERLSRGKIAVALDIGDSRLRHYPLLRAAIKKHNEKRRPHPSSL